MRKLPKGRNTVCHKDVKSIKISALGYLSLLYVEDTL